MVYRCDRAQCTDASASFPSFFTKDLAAVNRNLARLKSMTSDAELAERRCVTLERDRLMRLRKIDPRKVYGLFVLFQFDDYGHLRGPAAFMRWIGTGLRHSLPRRLPLPPT